MFSSWSKAKRALPAATFGQEAVALRVLEQKKREKKKRLEEVLHLNRPMKIEKKTVQQLTLEASPQSPMRPPPSPSSNQGPRCPHAPRPHRWVALKGQMCFKSEIVAEIARLHENSAYSILGVAPDASDAAARTAVWVGRSPKRGAPEMGSGDLQAQMEQVCQVMVVKEEKVLVARVSPEIILILNHLRVLDWRCSVYGLHPLKMALAITCWQEVTYHTASPPCARSHGHSMPYT